MSCEPVIGLECHVQLATASKLFCRCRASTFGLPPNSSVCPVCTGQPGTLPVLNRGAVELAFTASLAVGGTIRPESIFARKNYFYPDLPKGYQISQYEQPTSTGGEVEIAPPEGVPKKVRLHRIHMEEDAGKLVHEAGAEALPYSLVDFNRSSVPLIEIVTEPDLRSPQEAYAYLVELKAILQYLGVSNCDMEKGELRCDANVSVREPGGPFGTKVEIKNLNSFKAVRDAIEYEIGRQSKAVAAGEKLVQETRLWDDAKGETRPMRSKEEAHDYRYFPEPDLVPLEASLELLESLKARLPELPRARRRRFVESFGLGEYDAGVLTATRSLADYFEAAVKAGAKPKPAANWISTELLARLNVSGASLESAPVGPDRLAELVALVEGGTLSIKLAKEVFQKAWATGRAPSEIVREEGLAQVSDGGQLRDWASEALRENPRAVADFKGGNERALGALVGSVMKKSRGKANPGKINEVLKELLSSA